jgi:membrane protein YqaA with SNARE-associated domain
MAITKDQIILGILAIAIIVATYYISDFAVNLPNEFIKTYGIFGVFVVSILGTMSILLYLPLDATIFILSKVYPAELISLIAGIGSALGEMSSYLLGALGHKIIDKKNFKIVENNLKKHGFFFVFIASLTPIPYDLVGLAGGYLRLPILPFLGATMAGKVVRYYIIATSGHLFFNMNNH